MIKWFRELPPRRRSWLTLIIFICVLCNCPFLYIYHTVYDFVLTSTPIIFTTPLEPSITSDICHILELNENDTRCQIDTTYAYEFFDDFHQLYPTGTSQKQVVTEIDDYLVGCTYWTTAHFDGETEQYCLYDLRGDGVYPLYFRFIKQSCDDVDGRIRDFCTYNIHSLPFNSFQCNVSSNGPVIRTVEGYSHSEVFRRRCGDPE